MTKQAEKRRLVVATSNPGKVRELTKMLSPCGIEVLTQSNFDLPEIAETGLSFIENALIKARHASAHTHLAAIADDSGLEVDALQGQPGIYSARYAGAKANDQSNNAKLLAALADIPEPARTARFHCALALIRHPSDPAPIVVHHTWEGTILSQAQGKAGFGYDPLFYLPEFNCTAAELSPDQKNQYSHRGQALRTLVAKLPKLW